MKLSELARETSSIIEIGSPDLEITSAGGLDIAGSTDITFLANPKYTPQISETRARAIFLNEDVTIDRDDIAVLRAKDAYVAYTLALRLFFPERPIVPAIHPTAVIDPTAEIASDVEIHANVVIGGNCAVASGVRSCPHATLCEGVRIGRVSTIHSNVSGRENCERT